MKKKKAQIQMGESVAILFIFFILIVFGFVFYTKVLKSSSKVEIEENVQLKAIAVAQRASFLPELQCSQENVRMENCIDLLKLEHIDEMTLKNKLYYYDVFGFSRIIVEQKYPLTKTLKVYESVPATFKNKLATFIPTSLYNATENSYGFGVLVVEVFSP